MTGVPPGLGTASKSWTGGVAVVAVAVVAVAVVVVVVGSFV